MINHMTSFIHPPKPLVVSLHPLTPPPLPFLLSHVPHVPCTHKRACVYTSQAPRMECCCQTACAPGRTGSTAVGTPARPCPSHPPADPQLRRRATRDPLRSSSKMEPDPLTLGLERPTPAPPKADVAGARSANSPPRLAELGVAAAVPVVTSTLLLARRNL